MSDRPIGLGKVAENGTLNENGAFYSVQDINVLLEEKGGSGEDLPTPTVADAGKVLAVGEDGKWEVSEQYDLVYIIHYDSGDWIPTLLHGDYNTLVQKITDKKLIKILAYRHDNSGTANYYHITDNFTLEYDEFQSGNDIHLFAYFGINTPIHSILKSDNEMVYPD